MNEDILVGQVEAIRLHAKEINEGELIDYVDLTISSRQYRVFDVESGFEGDATRELSSDEAFVSIQELVASDDFTELVPVN